MQGNRRATPTKIDKGQVLAAINQIIGGVFKVGFFTGVIQMAKNTASAKLFGQQDGLAHRARLNVFDWGKSNP